MIDSRFVFLALCFNLYGSAYYARKALRGEIKPHLITWFLWALAPLIAFTAQAFNHVGLPALVTFISGFNPALIFSICIRRGGARWSITRFDISCGVLSLAGILLWAIFRKAEYAVAFSIAADGLASAPTFRKIFIDPKSEALPIYACLATSAVITLATIKVWQFSHYAFAAYLCALGVGMTASIGASRLLIKLKGGSAASQQPAADRKM